MGLETELRKFGTEAIDLQSLQLMIIGGQNVQFDYISCQPFYPS